jgi:hypothetical protein
VHTRERERERESTCATFDKTSGNAAIILAVSLKRKKKKAPAARKSPIKKKHKVFCRLCTNSDCNKMI